MAGKKTIKLSSGVKQEHVKKEVNLIIEHVPSKNGGLRLKKRWEIKEIEKV